MTGHLTKVCNVINNIFFKYHEVLHNKVQEKHVQHIYGITMFPITEKNEDYIIYLHIEIVPLDPFNIYMDIGNVVRFFRRKGRRLK